MNTIRRRDFLYLLLSPGVAKAVDLTLPLKPKSVRFAIIGDGGTGEKPQFEVAKLMTDCREKFPFDFVLMMGDNIYGGKSPADFKRKFEEPYAALLSANVPFYACLGNHDDTNERFYKPFGMDGKRYLNFKKGDAEFFVLDSNYMDPQQLQWIDTQLQQSTATWKICYFHHPLYSDGKAHGPDIDLRRQLEPIFLARGVNLVLTGHEHFYERLKPQKDIYYFVLGNSGQLRPNNIRKSSDMAKGFDTDQAFALMEISGQELFFQVISRRGETVDQGTLQLQAKK